MTLNTVLSLTALACALCHVGSASTIATGSVTFSFLGVTVDTPGAIVPHTRFSVTSTLAGSNGLGSFGSCPSVKCVMAGSPAIVSSPFFGDAALGVFLTFGETGRYAYTITSQVAPHIVVNGSINISTFGSFHDASNVFSNAAATLDFLFAESCGLSGCSESGSAVFETPPAATTQTPESSSLFLTGAALLGFCLARCTGAVGRASRF
jgi:hypothetical protein